MAFQWFIPRSLAKMSIVILLIALYQVDFLNCRPENATIVNVSSESRLNGADANTSTEGQLETAKDLIQLEEEIMREFIKYKLLDKLNMLNKSLDIAGLNKRHLPEEMLEAEQDENDGTTPTGGDDQKEFMVFATLSNDRVELSSQDVHIKIHLREALPDVSSAFLWAYVGVAQGNETGPPQGAFVVSVVNGQTSSELATNQGGRTHSGWISFDITAAAVQLHRQQEAELALQIRCKICDGTRRYAVVANDAYTPFVAFKLGRRSTGRQKRAVATCEPSTTKCCFQPLQINFHDLGFSRWWLFPSAANVNYCKGICTGDDPHSLLYHQHIMIKAQSITGIKKNLCCTPLTYSKIQVVHVDENGNVIREYIDGIVVKECGCQ